MTYEQKVKICNDVANWFADTTGVDYFEGCNAIEVTVMYSEYLKDSKSDFPELRKFFKS